MLVVSAIGGCQWWLLLVVVSAVDGCQWWLSVLVISAISGCQYVHSKEYFELARIFTSTIKLLSNMNS